jgi:hypothetical protein
MLREDSQVVVVTMEVRYSNYTLYLTSMVVTVMLVLYPVVLLSRFEIKILLRSDIPCTGSTLQHKLGRSYSICFAFQMYRQCDSS